ncbi:hypothetical protein [Priestia megaterium]|uniref:hypothetical protein n=1 Tax=Priestia megaterium TaxID=1404 RepID=UPI000BEC9DEB|nr:hypothetical protein [Priestia megaterium]MED4064422.1 hypothetical protein [Priestia megaterium]PEA38464.1 hypothetical protein CON45_12715 [Priestia megaterium]
MKDMIIAFVILLVIALLLFYLLFLVVKSIPKSARYIEIAGYAILVISLIWTSVVNTTEDISKGSEYINLNEKLNHLWYFNADLKDFAQDKNAEDLANDYFERNNYWQENHVNGQFVHEQEEIAKKINYGLFALSSLFILVGRLEELVNKKPISQSTSSIKLKNRARRYRKRTNPNRINNFKKRNKG